MADMPRYKISKNDEFFELLMSKLDRQDSVSEEAWKLIQMLATSEKVFKRVLMLEEATDPDSQKINWDKFFDSGSVYKLLYTL